MPHDDIELSVVIPAHDEASNVAPLLARLVPVLEDLVGSFEILFVDDGSSDGTPELVAAYAAVDPRVGALVLSRNFGKEVAIAAGLDHARGRAVVIMDADLQHPPETVREFVARWREGHVMVYGQRTDRNGESPMRRGLAKAFYGLFARFGEMPLPEGAGDFRLIDRRGVDVLKAMPERARFSKGLYAWIGFRSVGVPYVVANRNGGVSKWRFHALLRFAFDGLTSFSTVPLRVWTYVGGVIAVAALVTGLWFLTAALVWRSDVPGYPSLMVSIMFMSGVQMMSLGMIGEYVGRIFAEVKRRPLYVIAERVGASKAD